MGYPAKWQPFLRDVFLTSEGGYVKTGSLQTLFGVIDRVWVDALDRVPQAEINQQPEPSRSMLNKIRALPEGNRMGAVHEWMQMVGRELQPIGNGKQPESGQPLRSKEWAEAGGNKALVHSAQELALGIIHRDYIVGGHFEYLPLSQRSLCTVIDAAGRYGVAAAWTMVTKSARLSGYIDERQMNELGYVESEGMRGKGGTYKEDGGGFNYTIVSRRKDVGDAMRQMHSPELDARFFDAYGFWRRVYVDNYAPENEQEGDMLRIRHQHGDPSAALGRMEAWRTDRPQNAAKGGAPAKARGATPRDGDVALVQMEQGLISRSVAVQLPDDMGVVRYSVKYEDAYVDDSGKAVLRNLPMLDEVVGSLPPGVELVREGTSSKDKSYRNPYTDGDVLYWREPGTNKPQYLPIGGQFNDYALKLPTNTAWYSRVTWDDTATTTVGDKTAFDPIYSAHFAFDAGNPNKAPNWSPPENPSGTATIYFGDTPLKAPDTPKELAQATPKGPAR